MNSPRAGLHASASPATLAAMSTETPREAGFSMPAEWAPHRAVWLAFPHLDDEWRGRAAEAQVEHAALVRAIATEGHEAVELLVADDTTEARARALLGELEAVRYHRLPYGDAWTRDTAPIVLRDAQGRGASVRFRFNGWGGKFAMPGDELVGAAIEPLLGLRAFAYPQVLEGGAIEVDGEGTLLTTEQCLFEENRNPTMGRDALEKLLRESFGVQKVLWLRRGLVNDHTDGHIDTLARFVAPGRVVAMEPRHATDPHAAAMREILADLEGMTDARGRKLEVVRLPSPGLLHDHEGELLAASYCNFYVANRAVLVPTYGVPEDEEAVRTLGECFPERRVIGLSSQAIITGGGSFHCMTQQEPEVLR